MISSDRVSLATNGSLSLKTKPNKSLARSAVTLQAALRTIEGILAQSCAVFRYFDWPVCRLMYSSLVISR